MNLFESTVRRLAVALVVAACAGGDVRTVSSAADSARQFTQSFYDWYLPLGDRASSSRYDSILVARASMFAVPLLSALRDDVDAQRRTPDIVSVIGDYDPFLNSQDPCTRYDAREAVPSRAGYAVSVYSICADGTTELAVIADVERQSESWAFVNFRIPDQATYDLVSQLKATKTARDAPRPLTPAPRGIRP